MEIWGFETPEYLTRKERKKVALVLSGGAALGFAHIGVIKVLEENNIPIEKIEEEEDMTQERFNELMNGGL